MGARNREGIGLSYRPARLHRLAEFMPWIDSWAPYMFKNTGPGWCSDLSIGLHAVGELVKGGLSCSVGYRGGEAPQETDAVPLHYILKL